MDERAEEERMNLDSAAIKSRLDLAAIRGQLKVSAKAHLIYDELNVAPPTRSTLCL